MKKVLSLIMALALIICLAPSALAETAAATGSITIENAIKNQSYYVYRVFDLESYDVANKAFSYTVNASWSDFISQDTVRGKFVTLESKNGSTYVNWIDGADVKEFAKLAIEYAKAHTDTISPVDGITITDQTSYTFNGLPLGYYLIDSSVGALCALTTTKPDATVKEKNELTTVVKKVLDTNTTDYGSENKAKIGDTVSFKSEITVGEGVENLVLHDKMDNTLALNADSFKLFVGTTQIDAANYTVNTAPAAHDDDTQCTFEIAFKNEYTATLAKGTVISVEYTAVLKPTAKVSEESNDNTTWVVFGDGLTSTNSTTKTYTYKFDIIKTDADGKILQGAEFYLYDAPTGGNLIPVIILTEDTDSGKSYYRLASAAEAAAGRSDVIKAGKATVLGLDAKTYYLEEVTAPAGYNKLAERVAVDLTNGNKIMNPDVTPNNGTIYGEVYDNATGGVQVINKAGTELPSTGGIGTKLLYASAVILLVSAYAVSTASKKSKKSR